MHTYICYIGPREAKKDGFLRAKAFAGQAPGLLAGAQGLVGPGLQALHPAQLPGVRHGKETFQLPALLYRPGSAALSLRA
jgi:hypothetical protein